MVTQGQGGASASGRASARSASKASISQSQGGDGAGAGDMNLVLMEAAKRMSLAAGLAQQQANKDADKDRREHRDHKNPVLEDGILKENMLLQESTRRCWERKWGFLAEQEQLFRAEAAAEGLDPRPAALRPAPRTSSEPQAQDEAGVLPSPPVPTLSSRLVGWRSSNPAFSLERVGALYRSPLRTVDPPEQPGDPPRGMQSFIFLG